GELVRSHVSTVLGHPSSADIGADDAFQDLGFDSLTAVELRNHLKAATGLPLAPTLIFDHPTPTTLAQHLRHLALPQIATDNNDEHELRQSLNPIPISRLRDAGVLDILIGLIDSPVSATADNAIPTAESIDDMDLATLVRHVSGPAAQSDTHSREAK